MRTLREISFPPPASLEAEVAVDPHKIHFSVKGRTHYVSICELKSAAYSVVGNSYHPPGGSTMSRWVPEVTILDGTIVLDSNVGMVIGGTDVAIGQATGSRLRVEVDNPGTSGEVQRFTFLGGISSTVWLRDGSASQTTTIVGQSIEVTFPGGQATLGIWQ